jgi:hypothetical protein
MITENHIKEDLSRAYLMAAAGRAGCLVQIDGESHDYGIDAQVDSVRLVGKKRKKACCPVHIQLKATVNWTRNGNMIEYDLDVPTFNHLVTLNAEKNANPVVLVILCLPADPNHWAIFEQDVLQLRECCYFWLPPDVLSKKAPKSSESLQIPIDQQLTPNVLTEFLLKRMRGEPLQ